MSAPSTDKRRVLKRMKAVRAVVIAEISGHAARDRLASALAGEGFAGGYLEALNDIEAALVHGYPTDTSGYWRRAEGEKP